MDTNKQGIRIIGSVVSALVISVAVGQGVKSISNSAVETASQSIHKDTYEVALGNELSYAARQSK